MHETGETAWLDSSIETTESTQSRASSWQTAEGKTKVLDRGWGREMTSFSSHALKSLLDFFLNALIW